MKQWREGYSAYELAESWEEVNNLPFSVEYVFKKSNISLFHYVNVLYGFPEYKVPLPGGKASSQNDLYVLAKVNNELMTIMVEGKVSEPFGETVVKWLGANPSAGKQRRLGYLQGLLGLQKESLENIRYQLLHRTASALVEAEKVNANNFLMLVHSFSEEGKWFEDYSAFVGLFNLHPKQNEIVGPVQVNGVNLYFGWVNELLANKEAVDKQSKQYYFNMFKTEKARMLAKEIDDYIYNKSPYMDEVGDYHHRYNNGVRTDCIGYISKKGSYKFATITSARKVCFILHLGKILHTETAKQLQKEIDVLLGHVYEKTDGTSPTLGEVYIRLEWVDSLEQITSFIDKAYELRLQRK